MCLHTQYTCVLTTYQKFQSRLAISKKQITLGEPGWTEVVKTLRLLGPQCMSDDESDTDDRGEYFRVRELPWLCVEVKTLLRAVDSYKESFDNTYRVMRKQGRKRVPHVYTGEPSERRAKCELPTNFYNVTWVKTLTKLELGELRMTMPEVIPTLVSMRRYSVLVRAPYLILTD